MLGNIVGEGTYKEVRESDAFGSGETRRGRLWRGDRTDKESIITLLGGQLP